MVTAQLDIADLVRIWDLFFLISNWYSISFNQLSQNIQPPQVAVEVKAPKQGGKTMQAAGEADEPEVAMREAARPASLVHNTMLNSFWSRIDIQ